MQPDVYLIHSLKYLRSPTGNKIQTKIRNIQICDKIQTKIINIQICDKIQTKIRNIQICDKIQTEIINIQICDKIQTEIRNIQICDKFSSFHIIHIFKSKFILFLFPVFIVRGLSIVW